MLVAILVEWRIDAQDYVAKEREKANVVRNGMVPSGSYCFQYPLQVNYHLWNHCGTNPVKRVQIVTISKLFPRGW